MVVRGEGEVTGLGRESVGWEWLEMEEGSVPVTGGPGAKPLAASYKYNIITIKHIIE